MTEYTKVVDGEIITLTPEEVTEFLTGADIPQPPYTLYKTTLWLRLSDAEAETVMVAKNQQPAKFRGLWDDALSIQSDSQFFGTLKAFLAGALSADRAEQILQPEQSS